MTLDLIDRIDRLAPERRRAFIDTLKREGESYGVHPLTAAEARMWLLAQLRPASPVYNVAFRFDLTGELDVAALDAALRDVVARHAALRSVFVELDGEPHRAVLPADAHELRLQVREPAAADVAGLVRDEARRPFQLERGPLVRAVLLRTGASTSVLVLTLHHIVCDGWSMRLIYEDLEAAYAARRAGAMLDLPAQRVRRAATVEREPLLAYWREALDGAPRSLDLLTDRPRPAVLGDDGDQVSFSWPAELAGRIADAARDAGATPFVVLAAAFQALLHRYTGQQDILIGSPVAGRDARDADDVVGLFVNTVVLRSRTTAESTFAELLAQARGSAFGALAHQRLPFHDLVDHLQTSRELSAQPLFQVMLAVEEGDEGRLTLPGVSVRGEEQHTGTAMFDLTFVFVAAGERLEGRIEYRTDLFERDTILRLAEHMRRLLEAGLDAPDRPLDELPLLSNAELAAVRGCWGTLPSDPPDRRPVHRLIEDVTDTAPGAPAISDGERTLTYRQLDERANHIAGRLRAAGVATESAVGVYLPRGTDLAAAFLGVLKAGAMYVPLDVALPEQRLRELVADAGIGVVLTQAGSATRFDGVLTISVDETAFEAQRVHVDLDLDNAAYLIFTSGSTGRPKGVVGTHRGLRQLADAQRQLLGVRPDDRVLQFHSPGFDVSVSELVTALCAGAELRTPAREAMLPGPDLAEILRRHAITVADLPPVALAATEPAGLDRLRSVTVGGEACPADVAVAWSRGRDFVNAYGPTETTVTATAGRYESGSTVPIGRPVPGARAYVLDAHRRPVPFGVKGELYVGGAGVTRGYFGDPALTAERFVPDPFARDGAGDRMCRTGDLVRLRGDGALEFLGRTDAQVKVRGHRIELGEITATLRAVDAVRQAGVVLRTDGPAGARLVAYLVGDGIEIGAIRRELADRLPRYMVPDAYVVLDALPLTPGGKLDERSLPAPSDERPDQAAAYASPRTRVEERLVMVWREVLGLTRVGVHDNFFDVGGNSLLLAKVRARLAQELAVEIPALELFRHPTPALLARFLEAPAPPERRLSGADRELAGARRAVAERGRRRRPQRQADAR